MSALLPKSPRGSMSSNSGWSTSAFGRHPWLAGFTVFYVIGWTAYGFAADTGQVYAYLAWLVGASALVIYVDGRVRFSTPVLVLLSVAGFCHMAGGNIQIDGTVLYEQSWSGYVRYDHLVHAFGLGAAGLAVWEATRRMLTAQKPKEAVVVVMLGGNAIGAAIEIGEYIATLLLPDVRVGGYTNSMQDLIANLVGSLVAAWWAVRRCWHRG